MKKNSSLILGLVVVLLLGVGVYYYMNRQLMPKNNQVKLNNQVNNLNDSVAPVAQKVEYKNTQYGFDFALPNTWNNYSIIEDKWSGNVLEASGTFKAGDLLEGPKILIRHSAWTTENKRQDIPVMVFNLSQWNLIQQERLSLGAAPIGPQELGRNNNYVFALPARYNFAFITGFEEVEAILKGNALTPTSEGTSATGTDSQDRKMATTKDFLKQAFIMKYPQYQEVYLYSIKTDKDNNNQNIRATAEFKVVDATIPVSATGILVAEKKVDGSSWEIVYDKGGRPTCAELKSQTSQYSFSNELLDDICIK